jgi:hypothetical protein
VHHGAEVAQRLGLGLDSPDGIALNRGCDFCSLVKFFLKIGKRREIQSEQVAGQQ